MPAIKVFLYKNDYNAMCAEIYRHQRIETGGNLFGLWTTSGDVVIYAALGPGKDCRRTEHSFHQDIPYLERVGRFLNDRYMLCHVGEWHSHHQLSLKEPSAGDVRTVWDNYPLGMKKFLVIIGNLVASDQVLLSPYFFLEGRPREYVKGKFEVLQDENPFTLDLDIARVMEKGSEGQEREIRRGVSVENDYSRDTSKNARLPPSDHVSAYTNRPQHYETGLVNISTSSETGTTSGTTTVTATRQTSSNDSPVKTPPRDYATVVASSGTSCPGSTMSTTQTTSTVTESKTTSKQVSAQVLNRSTSNDTRAPSDTAPENNKQTRRETIIQKICKNIESHFIHPKIDLKGELADEVSLKFEHNRFWLIKFPKEFPKEPANIYKSYGEDFEFKTRVRPPHPMTRRSLNNCTNIILTVIRSCDNYSCTTCTRYPVKSLVDPDIALFLSEEGLSFVNEYTETVERDLADAGSLKKAEIFIDTKNPTSVEEPIVKISFKHRSKIWIVKLASAFPDPEPKLSYIDDERYSYESQFHYASRRKLSVVSRILLAIAQKCRCAKCKGLEDNTKF